MKHATKNKKLRGSTVGRLLVAVVAHGGGDHNLANLHILRSWMDGWIDDRW